jgi:radical SAM superfamily enzyme YgiQ (UPF0313 family)
MRIGLIALYILESNGIRYLSASLRKAGHEVDEFYFGHFVHHHFTPPTEEHISRLVDLIKQRNIDLVGIAVRIGALFPTAIELTRRIRDEAGVPVMWGGAHVTMAPEQCVEHPDWLVLGEAENAIVDVAKTFESSGDVSAVQNVWMKRGDEVVRNELRPLIQDLDSIPFPDFTTTECKFWVRPKAVVPGEPLHDETVFRIMASRGCPFKCAFCGVTAFRKRYGDNTSFYRVRSVDNCLDEMEQAKRTFPRLKRIRFDDELFTPNKAWIEGLTEKFPKRIGLVFDLLSNPRCLDESTVEKLARAGLDAAFVGIQGPEKSNEELYDRYVPDKTVVDVAKRLHRHRVRPMFQVLIDDPMAKPEQRGTLLDLLLALPRPYDLLIYSLCHWPGTARTTQLLEQGLISEGQVEGHTDKVLHQFNADFSWKRSSEDTLFLALYYLSNKRWIPRGLIRKMAESERMRKRPGPAIALAVVANSLKLLTEGTRLFIKGELSMHVIRRWLDRAELFKLPSI